MDGNLMQMFAVFMALVWFAMLILIGFGISLLKHLVKAVDSLNHHVGSAFRRLDDHENRISKLETHV